MSLEYRLVQRGNPTDPDAPKKYYANPVTRTHVTLRVLSKEIADISTVSPADTMAVIESLLQLIPNHVALGDIVRLGDFGSFSIGLSSQGAATAEDFTSGLIKGLKMRFEKRSHQPRQL